MIIVRPFEADLLRALQAILAVNPAGSPLGLVLRKCPRPRCLSRPAIELIEQTLALGIVRRLARSGGWRLERFLRDGKPVEGRLWQRSGVSELGLHFSRGTVDFLIALVADEPETWASSEPPDFELTTVGDELLALFTYRAFQATKLGTIFRNLRCFRDNELCRLVDPVGFSERQDAGDVTFKRWVAPARAWVLEALADEFASAWIVAEPVRRQVVELAQVRRIGHEQVRVAAAYLDAAGSLERRDLARFVLDAARELLADPAGLTAWWDRIDFRRTRLADRSEARLATLGSLNGLDRLQSWTRQCREIGYFDEGYSAAKLWLAEWEQFDGDELCRRFRNLVRATDVLATDSG